MRIPVELADSLKTDRFEKLLEGLLKDRKLLPEGESLHSERFLRRSVVPHVEKLSAHFNRMAPAGQGEKTATVDSPGIDAYWKESSNPKNLRMAYLLGFMPPNLFRVAAVWSELARLGFRWGVKGPLRGLELGAGPATGASGIGLGEAYAPIGLPSDGSWALIEQDRHILEWGEDWAGRVFSEFLPGKDWTIRAFPRRIEAGRELLPKNAPAMNLWLTSYFLNELKASPAEIAETLLTAWDRQLEEEGLVILVEPALKRESRRLLELRREILARKDRRRGTRDLQLLLPCLGHQSCGALAAPEDWCHEEATWWRPPYLRQLDQMTGLDRKSLPFSYLVFVKSARPREELLPALRESPPNRTFRLVSPAHEEGRDLEFFTCGQEGKRKTRFRPATDEQREQIGRGSILLDAEIRGDAMAGRVDRADRVL
jgi:hypothetical protein